MFITLFFLAVLSLLAWFLHCLHQRFQYFAVRGIAHEKPNYLVGNLTGIRSTRSFLEICLTYYKKFKGTGPFCGFFWFQRPTAFILDTKLAKAILIKDFNNFVNRGFYTNAEDDKLSPTFTTDKMKQMFATVSSFGEELALVVGAAVAEAEEPIIEMRDYVGRYTSDVIGTCVFGIEPNSLRNANDEFYQMNKRVFTATRYGRLGFALINCFPRLFRKWHVKSIPDHITEFYMRLIRQNFEQRERNNIERNNFFGMLLDLKNSKLMTNEDGELTSITVGELATQAFVFLIAGFETSLTTMAFALYELAQYEDIQERVRDEIVATLAKHNGKFTYDCMKEMAYLQQVISDEFNPDNFARERVAQRDSVEWLPFGDGPRNCIGMRFGLLQTRIGLALLLRDFKFTVCGKTPKPMTYEKLNFLVASEHGICLYVEKV